MAKNKYENLTEAEITALESRRLERKVKRASEIKAFLILLLIIVVISGGTWYWYTHIYDGNKNKKEENTKVDYEITKIDTNASFERINNKYIVERKNGFVYKIYNLIGEPLYDGKIELEELIIDNNDNIYGANYVQLDETTNGIELFKLDNKEFKEEKKFLRQGITYSLMNYTDLENNTHCLGIVGQASYEEILDENGTEKLKTSYYLFGKDEVTLENLKFVGETIRIVDITPIEIGNPKYAIVERNKKYGVLDITSKELIIEPYYEQLYTTKNGDYIAYKGGKAGIIDIKQKSKVDFAYDFIDNSDKDIYVLGLNSKLSIMDKNFQKVTDQEFTYNKEYVYKSCCANENAFTVRKVGNKYILNITYPDDTDENNAYYLIDENSVKEYDNPIIVDDIIYTYDSLNNKYIFYDQDFKEKYTIQYETNNYHYAYLFNKSTIAIQETIDTTNSETYYYNIEDGKLIEKPIYKEYVTEIPDAKVIYNEEKSEITIDYKEKNTYKIDQIDIDTDIIKPSEETISIITNKYFIVIKKPQK